MKRTVAVLAVVVMAVCSCSSGKSHDAGPGILSGLVSAANAAPSCTSLVGKPLPQIAKSDGCIFVAADGSKNLRAPVSYPCQSGELFTFPGEGTEPAYWAVPGRPVVSGPVSAAERAGAVC